MQNLKNKFYLFTIFYFFIHLSFGQTSKKNLKDFITDYTDTASLENSVFGRKVEIAFAFEGTIYYLPWNTKYLPDFSKLKPAGKIYCTQLKIPTTAFSNGFPGVTDRFEYFAIDYKGIFYIEEESEYTFFLRSDDGSKLLINDTLIIDNDGEHQPENKEGDIYLPKGVHKIEVQYFQGPRDLIALTLLVSKSKKNFKVFDLKQYSPVKVTMESQQIRINMAHEVLFDFDKYTIKPQAEAVLQEVKKYFFDKLSGLKIVIEGHTDDTGEEKYNLTLSENRAAAVKKRFIKMGMDPSSLSIMGYGENKPKFPNNSDENKAKNRRVEIVIENEK